MISRAIGASGFAACVLSIGGCTALPVSSDADVGDIAAKAERVAMTVGGANGFGGAGMTGYFDHVPNHMGFFNVEDLASADDVMTLSIQNETQAEATFHVRFLASHMGLMEQMRDVAVPAGTDIEVEIPCAEIVGIGPLEQPRQPGCELMDGQIIENTMAVPGFLGLDYECGGAYEFMVAQDVEDLDGDGDTEELIVVSDAMRSHMMNGGVTGHMHGFGFGMMGMHSVGRGF